ncbi:uncharacterized protein [Antedon mediterranea]|uniref:uncharacterized protein n=1 Tax=Antedon mediterranea TaxID=105859 RepID=UPI003AF6B235
MAEITNGGVVSNEKLDIIRGSVEEGFQRHKILSDFGGEDDGKNDCTTRKAKLALSKQEYRKLKQDSQALQTRLQILDYLVNVNEENWPTISSKDDEYKKVYEEKKKVSNDLLDLEDEIQEFVEKAQEESSLLQDKISTLKQKLESVSSKKQKYEELYKQHTECLAKCQLELLNKEENFSDILEQQKQKVELTNAALQKCNSMMSMLTSSISENEENLQQLIKIGLEKLQIMVEKKKKKILVMKEDREWFEAYTKLNSKLFGVGENYLSENEWCVDLASSNEGSDMVTLELSRDPLKQRQCSDVKIAGDEVSINNAAQEAMDSNDVCYAIQEIRKQFTAHAPLAKEINSLRQRFAIDFLQDENVLICMFGSCGNIVCRLKIKPGYPSSGQINLEKVTGHTEDTICNPPMPNPTLTDWLIHLQQILV